jgi:hypothetical protein
MSLASLHGCEPPGGSAQLVDADQVVRGIADGGVANAVRLLGWLPVDPVADAAQPREVAQVLRRSGSAGHL